MKNLLAAVLLLCASVCAYGQGATLLFPPVTDPQGHGVPFVTINFCTTPTTVTNGVCNTPVTVFQNSTLTTPYSSAIQTDGIGNFPPNVNTATAIWFSPAANYCYSLSGSISATNICYPFSVPIASNSNPTFAGLTVTSPGITASSASISGNVAIGGPNPWYDVCKNGLACDGVTSDTTAFNALVTTSCAASAGTLWIPPGKTVRFGSAPNAIPCGLFLAGVYSKGSAFSFGSYILCDYTEVTAKNGCLTWTGASAGTTGNGGGMWGIGIQKGGTNTGGVAVKLTGTSCSLRTGDMSFDHIRISSSSGTWNYGLYVDGSFCTNAGTQGNRDNEFRDFYIFSATTEAAHFDNAVHNAWINSTTSPGTGIGDVNVTGAAGATAMSTDNVISVGITGNLTYDFADTTRCMGCNVTGTFTTTANSANDNYFDGILNASPTNTGKAAIFAKVNGLSYSYIGSGAVVDSLGLMVGPVAQIPSSLGNGQLAVTGPAGAGGTMYWSNSATDNLVQLLSNGNWRFGTTQASASLTLGSGTNNVKLATSAPSGTRTATFQDATGTVPLIIASGTSTFTTTLVTTGTCQTTVTTAATNALTTDSISWSYASAPGATTDSLLTLNAWPTAGNVNFSRCNPTAGSITPTALVLNWRVIR